MMGQMARRLCGALRSGVDALRRLYHDDRGRIARAGGRGAADAVHRQGTGKQTADFPVRLSDPERADLLADVPGRIRKQCQGQGIRERSEEHTSELQSLMRISYAVFCLKKKQQPLLQT